MYAYDKNCLAQAQRSLGTAFDYAVNYLGLDIDSFFAAFAGSGTGVKFGSGDSRTVCGMSGIELVIDICTEKGLHIPVPPVISAMPERSREYWTGWALAYYQWDSGLSFGRIASFISASRILSLYDPYHEMDIRQLCSRLGSIRKETEGTNALSRMRAERGLTQKQLSLFSGVPLRTLQQYEQGQKDLRKANAVYLLNLARALYCEPEDLLV